MEHQADVHPQLRLILPDAGPGCEKNGRRATWPVTTRSGRHQVPVAVLPTAKSLSAFSLKPQSDRLLGEYIEPGPRDATRTVERLLAILDRNDVLLALDRMQRRRVLRLVEIEQNQESQ